MCLTLEPEDQGRILGGHLLYIVCSSFCSVIMLNYFIQVIWNYINTHKKVQSVTCLATDASLTADLGVPVQSRPHTFYDHSHPFRVIIQEGLLSVTSESMCTE